ncbi:MAG: amino acid adenylation domain-containing protein, partial [Gammaproteobacteria bacterium]|nr:amino acid adenylation domain-containing protein [Gammaproteobacteria bacterium]
QDLPFEKLLEICSPPRSIAHTPLVQVSFNLHNEPGGSLHLGDMQAQVLPLDRGTTKFDLSMSVIETAAGLRTGIEYNTDLFAPATIRQMLLHYQELLTAMLDDIRQPPGTVALTAAVPDLRLPAPEPAFAAAAGGATLVERFDAIARLHPARAAVCTAERTVTYRELQARSNAIAAALLALQLPAASRVGVLLDQDAEMAAALLGSMRAGHTYVPLDRAAPLPRLRQAVAAAELAALVAAPGLETIARQLAVGRCAVVPLAEVTAAAAPPVDAAVADGLAYILFTSGSTGMPKGVLQSHRNVLHHAGVYADALQIRPDDRLTLFSAFGFDAAVMDIFGALLTGACLYPLDLRAEEYPGQTLDRISADRITLLHATPTVYRHLMRSRVCRHELDTVRAVVLGGERATSGDFDLFRKQFAAGTVFVNGLGPSESTLAAQFFANHDTRLPGGQVPVGKAVRATELLLLDAAGNPTSVEGELAVRSRYVACGYFGQPELTAARFIPVPGQPEMYTYKTGDRARRLPCGNLVFVGRTDDQLKVRGHRIEAGDIEAALTALDAVQRAAVVLRDTAAAEQAQLVAYVVGAGDAAAVRRQLRDMVPQYMVPDAIVFVPALPLTANGKLDRAALPEPRLDPTASEGYLAPRTDTERHLATLWADILGLPAVGVHDNFFEIGGHSLLAAQLAGRIHTSMQVVIPLRRLFDTPTIAQLADYIDTLRWAVEAGDGS